MPSSIVTISCSSSDYPGSAFSLWRSLQFHSLPKERTLLAGKAIHHIKLPISAHQLPQLGVRTQRLLFRRTTESIPPRSTVFMPPALSAFRKYRELCTAPSGSGISQLYLQFLPDILQTVKKQWGFPPDDASCCILSRSCEISALCSSLAPYVRHMDVVTSDIPSYQVQNDIWETWGIPVCFRKEIPSDTHLLVIGDWPDPLPEMPANAMILNPDPSRSIGINPNMVFFRFPGSFSNLATTLGGISLPSLSMILSAFYSDPLDATCAKDDGFSISRIHREKGKFSS